jgi:hypothetical protein
LQEAAGTVNANETTEINQPSGLWPNLWMHLDGNRLRTSAVAQTTTWFSDCAKNQPSADSVVANKRGNTCKVLENFSFISEISANDPEKPENRS